MKGQSPVFEQVMLFVIGIAIFITCFSMFKIYEVYFTDMTIHDQLTEVKDFITSKILTISKKDEINSSRALKIPRRILDHSYEISLSGNGINVTSPAFKAYVDSGLYNLTETFDFSGRIISSYGKHIIYKKGNKIIIE